MRVPVHDGVHSIHFHLSCTVVRLSTAVTNSAMPDGFSELIRLRDHFGPPFFGWGPRAQQDEVDKRRERLQPLLRRAAATGLLRRAAATAPSRVQVPTVCRSVRPGRSHVCLFVPVCVRVVRSVCVCVFTQSVAGTSKSRVSLWRECVSSPSYVPISTCSVSTQ